MRTKRILIFLPLLLALVLLQSAFWVPTQGSRAAARAGRLTTFVETKQGDVKLLNSILHSDNPTSEVIDRRIFDRLVEANERLEYAPGLAESWAYTEEAYLAVRPERRLADGSPVTGPGLVAAIERALRGALAELAPVVQSVELVPAEVREQKETTSEPTSKGKSEPIEVTLRVRVPERVRLRLSRIEPHLFKKLESLLDAGYFQTPDVEGRFDVEPARLRAAIAPRFAELLPVGEHNPVLTLRLRGGVRFHDGQPFTSKDVAFTYRAAIDPKNVSPRAAAFEPVARIETPDPLTVRVTYKRLHSTALIDWMIGMLPEHLLNAKAMEREMNARNIPASARSSFSLRNSDFNRRPVGTGPFRFVDWKPEQYIEVARNEDYWGERPNFERVFTRVIPDKLAQELELRTGALDIYEAEPHQGARLREDERLQVLLRKEGLYYYIGYNLRRPLFQDVRVRRALGMAINVDEIIRYVLSGEGVRSTGPFYSNTPFMDKSVKPLPFDPAGALELLRQVGYVKNSDGWLVKDGKPLEFTLITNAGNPQRKAIITIAQENWRRLGIRCNTQVFEWTVFLGQFVHVGNFDATVLGWVGNDISPDKYQIWHSSQVGNHKLNFVGYQNAEADALMDEIRVEYDRARQIELTHRLHRRIAEDQPYTFLYEPARPYALDARLAERMPGAEAEAPPKYRRIRTTESGEINYFFKRWVMRPTADAFAP